MVGTPQHRHHGHDHTLPRLLSGRLCLDFVNTIENPLGDVPEDFLHTYGDIVRWARHTDLLSTADAAALLAASAQRPEDAAIVFDRGLALRAALTRIFRAVARGEQVPPGDLAALQDDYLVALTHAQLAPTGHAFSWTWPDQPEALDRPLWAIARSAVAVLTEDDPARLRECPGTNDCGWLFYDTSRGGRRRWCSMEGCGSRVKMRALTARRRPGSAT